MIRAEPVIHERINFKEVLATLRGEPGVWWSIRVTGTQTTAYTTMRRLKLAGCEARVNRISKKDERPQFEVFGRIT